MVNAASCDLPKETPPFPLAESGPDSANEKGRFPLAGSSDMVNAASCHLPIETSPFPLAESGPDSANGKGGFPLAGRKKQHLPCPMSLPMQTPRFHWRNQGLIPPMEREVSTGTSQEAALTMSDEPANGNPPLFIGGIRA